MKNFKIGQEVVCTNRYGWHERGTMTDTIGPSFNEVVTIFLIEGSDLVFVEYKNVNPGPVPYDFYPMRDFEPLITDSELVEQLESIPVTI